jgi:Domain of unknown function (DUF1932)
MGAAVGNAIRGEVLWASQDRSEETARRAEGFTDVGSVAELVRASDVILSICPPAIAEDVAEQVFAESFGGLFVDANAISPERMRRIAGLSSRVLDGSIISATGINLYLAGEGTDTVAALFEGSEEVTVIPIGTEIGSASALKMAFGGWNKIGIALTGQAHAIARAYGVTDWLEAEGVPPDRLPAVSDRAWRWAPEMEEIAATCGELELSDEIPHAAAAFYRDVSRAARPS